VLFLADESCDFAVVRALRAANHDVLAMVEVSPGAEDAQVIREACDRGRVLLTEDRDFGRLVFASNHETSGVIYLRYPATARGAMAWAVVDFVGRHAAGILGCFVVLQPGRSRVSRF